MPKPYWGKGWVLRTHYVTPQQDLELRKIASEEGTTVGEQVLKAIKHKVAVRAAKRA